MKVDRIITMASEKVRLEFTAMERSLRATGCHLPLLVIPFDESRFPLPENAEWLTDDELFHSLSALDAVPVSRKYAALLQRNCAYFDSDIIHLRNPQEWLTDAPSNAFVVADTEWNKAKWTFTSETKALYQAETTLWLLRNFNAGFFSFETPPLSKSKLCELLAEPILRKIIQGNSPTNGEQAGTNFIVWRCGLEVCNLCLPPHYMESTMALDYPPDFETHLRSAYPPAFIHFAGEGRNLNASIAKLIFDHLTEIETQELKTAFASRQAVAKQRARWPILVRLLKRIVPILDKRFSVTWVG